MTQEQLDAELRAAERQHRAFLASCSVVIAVALLGIAVIVVVALAATFGWFGIEWNGMRPT